MLEFLTKKIQRTGRESGRGKTEALKGNEGGENGFLNRFFDYMEKSEQTTLANNICCFSLYTRYICFRNVLITLLALTTVKNVHLSGFESMKYSIFHFCNAFSNYWQSHTLDLLVRRL